MKHTAAKAARLAAKLKRGGSPSSPIFAIVAWGDSTQQAAREPSAVLAGRCRGEYRTYQLFLLWEDTKR